MSIENYRSGEEKIDSEGKDKKSKDGLLSKIKNTLAIGAVVGMTALSSPDASAENFSANETATDNTKAVSYTHLTLPTIYSV